MAKKQNAFVCSACGANAAAWTGRCMGCGEWATVDAQSRPVAHAGLGITPDVTAQRTTALAAVDRSVSLPLPVGIDEVDRVLGGGLMPGSVTLLSGEPGIGKSTLTLQMACSIAGSGAGVVIVTGEEAPSQVADRAARLGSIPASLAVLDDTSVSSIIATLEAERPAVAIIDSIQTVAVDDLEASPGSVTQIREAAARLVTTGRRLGVSIVLIGHVTKDGTLAGPRLLEHVVDTVLSFVGDRHHDLRFLRAVKHRFGPTTEVGLFEMTGLGLAAVSDPSSRFLIDRRPDAPGSIVVPALDGHRPVLIEIQALLAPHGDRPGQVEAQGVSASRSKLVTAVLEQRAGLSTFGHHVFVSAAGGAVAVEPGVDLAIGLAIASALTGIAIPADLVACGEVGLVGEIRTVPQMDRRLSEAFRLGFRSAIVPPSTTGGPTGLRLIRSPTVSGALEHVAATRHVAAV